MVHELVNVLHNLGGLAGLGALIASISTYKETRKRLRPNHGSSIADGIARVEKDVTRIGHEIGEIRTDLSEERRDRRAWDEALSDRLISVENRKR